MQLLGFRKSKEVPNEGSTKAKQAMEYLDGLQKKFEVEMNQRDYKSVVTQTIQTKWEQLPRNVADSKIKYTAIGTHDEIVSMPPHTEVYKHWHHKQESILVLRGAITYELWDKDKKIDEGLLEADQKLIIDPRIDHAVMSTDVESILYVVFE